MSPTVPFTYYRGGTSKALFFHASELPPPGPHRDALLLRLMGSPDPLQIDGMGGSHPVTSKIAIVAPSRRPDVEVDYLFAQVSIKTRCVSYDGGCGNISAAVGPFAINERLVQVDAGSRKDALKQVTIWMEGTGTKLVAHVPLRQGRDEPREEGDFRIDGCPGTGAPIYMDYKHTAGGAVKRGLLPTSEPVNYVTVRGRSDVPVTVCDIAHIIVFGRATDFGIRGDEEPQALNRREDLIDAVREFRGRAAEMVGLVSSWEKVDEEAPNLPYVVLLSPSLSPLQNQRGQEVEQGQQQKQQNGDEEEDHIRARLFLDNHCHTSMAGAGATCTAACSKISGTLVNTMSKPMDLSTTEFRVRHPLGLLPITVEVEETSSQSSSSLPEFRTLGFVRTARRLAKGDLFVPHDFQREWDGE